MKKFLIILGSLIGLLLLAMILIPYFYKDDLLNYMKKEANKNLEAEVSFNNDIGLSLFKNFPDFTLTVKDIKVVNKAPFKGDTLAQVKKFQTTIDLMSLISGDQMQIEGLHLNNPRIHVKVLKDGTANYNIMPTDTTTQATTQDTSATTGSGSFKMALKSYSINNGYLVYDDKSLDFYTKLKDLDHKGSGDFTMDVFNLDTRTTVKKLTVGYGGVNYLDQVNTLLDAKLKMNMKKMKFTFLENKLSLNEFAMGFDGYLAMPKDDIKMDFTFDAKETGFRNLLSLVPAIYTKNFESLKTSGSLAFNGKVEGIYNDNSYPGYQVNLKVNNGHFQYPDLPKALNNVNLDLSVNCPDGKLDNTVANLKQLHFEVGQEPFDAKMLLKTPMSDPFVDASMNGTINLGNMSELIPLGEKTEISGVLESQLAVKGHYSSIEKENYDQFKAQGDLSLTNFRYASPALNQAVEIKESQLSLTPQKANLSKFDMKIGESELFAQGQVDNMLGYALKGNTLKGSLTVRSNYFNLNPILASEEGSETQEQPESGSSDYQLEAPAIPGNINFTLQAELFKKLIYDNMEFSNITGKVVIRDKALHLKDFRMNLLDGSMIASGRYDTKNPNQPYTDFDLKIMNFDIQKSYQTFTTIQKYAPVAAKAKGSFNADLVFKSPFRKDLTPIYDSLYSKGQLTIDKVTISEHKIFNKVANILNNDAYQRIVMTDIKPSYIIENGRIRLTKPIDFNIGDSKFSFTGSMGLDQTLDYVLHANVPGGEVQQKASQFASRLVGKQVDLGNRILMDFNITGTSSNPKVKPSFVGTKGGEGGAQQQLKQRAREKIQKQKQKVEQKAKEEVEQAKQKAKEEAEKAKQKAKEKAEQKKEKAKEEVEKKKEKVKEKAKDKVKDIFK